MIEIIGGGILLSIIHASIPNHWLPLVALGKERRWNGIQLAFNTLLIGSSHVTSTVLIGVAVGLIGLSLQKYHQWVFRIVAPLVFLLLGLLYLYSHFKSGATNDTDPHDHHHSPIESAKRNKIKLLSLAVAMFFSPCFELELYYIEASKMGWSGIFGLSTVYFVVTVSVMIGFVLLASFGIEKIMWSFLEKKEKLVMGWLFILIAIFSGVMG